MVNTHHASEPSGSSEPDGFLLPKFDIGQFPIFLLVKLFGIIAQER
jgi:hypothetical protein